MASGYGFLLFDGGLVCGFVDPVVTGDKICKAMGYNGFKDWDTFSLKKSFLNDVNAWSILENYAMYISKLECHQENDNGMECLYIPVTSAHCSLVEALFIECKGPGNLKYCATGISYSGGNKKGML